MTAVDTDPVLVRRLWRLCVVLPSLVFKPQATAAPESGDGC
jgi:hypothetical protein